MNRWTLFGLAAIVGCEELTPCERAALIEEPTLTVGLGERHFEQAIEDGDPVTPIYGSQGGQHLWLAVRTSGLNPGQKNGFLLNDEDVPTFYAELIGAEDEVLYAEQSWAYFAMDGDETEAELALGEFFLPGMPERALNQPLILRVTASDVCGAEIVGEAVIDLQMEG